MDLLTKKNVCDQWGVSLRTLESWIADGLIPVVRMGGSIRFTQKDVEDFVLNRRTAPDPEVRLKSLVDLIPALTLAQRTDLAVQLLRT